MFRWLFGKKEDIEEMKEQMKASFNSVKNDMNNLGEWIRHLNSQDEIQKKDVKELKEELSTMKMQMQEIQDFVSFWRNNMPKQAFRKKLPGVQTGVYEQTVVQAVQTGVQTGVQTAKIKELLENLTANERLILWSLLNTDMKLSYEDLAAMLGKTKNTIRGQINSIRQKSEGLIKEVVEPNGKKRLFVPSEIREKIVKSEKAGGKAQKKAKSLESEG
ncbi:hypothetical protein COV15_01280 [Candidatus Woesearchaeota archaeon CG10_big_fil_rev_8_21_14_0_10_34_12]|nr:MAG: hypothetical protein COV15_01280 [Candidatus Woesearchaeota archaeon CG10_big_fil_rev_8_21_14_0_10_34_12]